VPALYAVYETGPPRGNKKTAARCRAAAELLNY